MKLRAWILFVLMVAAAGRGAGLAVARGRTFTLAVIPEEDSGLADVFFSVLAKTPNATLVERAELERLAREAGLTSLAGGDPVRLGQLVKADALVFVRRSGKRLFVRLTETLRGVRLFQAVDDATVPGAEQLAGIVQDQLNRRAALLAADAADRRYLAIDPFVVKKDRRTRCPEFEHLHDLLAVRLATLPGVVCLEREALDRVDFERKLDAAGKDQALTRADWLLRGVCDVKDGSVASVALHVQSLHDSRERHRDPAEVRSAELQEGLSAMTAWIGGILDVGVNRAAPLDASREAVTQFAIGRTYAARGLRDRALRCYRVAHILDPHERSYTWTLASSLVGSVGERTDRLSKMEEMIEAMDLCQYVLCTNRCCFDDSYSNNTYPWQDLPTFLRGVPSNPDDSDRELVSRFRRRFRAYVEWLYGFKDGVPNKRH